MSPFHLGRPRVLARLSLEGTLIFVVLYGLGHLTLSLIPHLVYRDLLMHVTASTLLFAGCLGATNKSRLGDETNLGREFAIVCLVSVFLGLLSFLLYWLLFHSTKNLSALLMLEGAIVVPGCVIAWRWLVARYSLFGGLRERILIVGTGESASRACRWIAENHSIDYVVVGFADADPGRAGSVVSMGARILTDFDSLPGFCPRRVDRVLLALDEKRGRLPIESLMQLRLSGMEIEEVATFFERTSGKIAVEAMLPSWLIFSDGFRCSAFRQAGKRLSDLVSASFLLAVASPFMLLLAALIRLDSRGGAFYRQERVGKNGKPFELLKFRSMIDGAEEATGPVWAGRRDSRVTRVGRVIRVLRLDELPQLLNVLRGEMSFVGPRPERPHFVDQLQKEVPYYSLRATVRPGITGWAQVCYPYGATVEDSLEKLKYDLYYIKNCNPLFDFWIVIKTIKVVLLGSGAR